MGKAVERRAGELLGAEHGRPLVERQIVRHREHEVDVLVVPLADDEVGPSGTQLSLFDCGSGSFCCAGLRPCAGSGRW
jgi:hypothetical protein